MVKNRKKRRDFERKNGVRRREFDEKTAGILLANSLCCRVLE
jgi:hypothetical protein